MNKSNGLALAEMSKRYWEGQVPMEFVPEGWTWRQKRQFRYKTVPYLRDAFKYKSWGGKRVLEIGCGAGIDSLEFMLGGAEVTAIDISGRAVAATSKLFKEANDDFRGVFDLRVSQYDGEHLPFPDEAFDCVYSCGVLHHIPDLDGILAEIRRVLKDDGTLLAMVYNRYSLAYAFMCMYLGGETERVPGVPYVHPMTKEEAEKVFSLYFWEVQVTTRYNVIDLPTERKVKFEVKDHDELGWHLVIRASGRKG